MQTGLLFGFGLGQTLGQHPGLGRVERLVDAIGLGHDAANGFAIFPRFKISLDLGGAGLQFGLQGVGVPDIGQCAIKIASDKSSGAAGDIDIFADQIAIDAGDEVIGIEIQILDVRVELRRDVIA